jgi:hypothetical protein
MQPQPDYDFIMNTDHAPKKPLLPRGDSKQGRIFLVIGGAVALITILVVIMALISAAGNAGKADLVKAAQQQAEIIRVSKIGIDKARDPSARNLATTTNLSLLSDQTTLLAALGKKGIRVGAKDLALGKDSKTDIALTTAEQSNRFDEVFTQTIKAELTEYQATLKKTYDSASSKSLKATLSDQYKHAGQLAGKQ